MRPLSSEAIAASRFRANPRYELVWLGDLPERARQDLTNLMSDQDLAGILRPLGPSSLRPKALTQIAADLYTRLRIPGPVAGSLGDGSQPISSDEIAGLVLGGVLEVETDSGFITGPDAQGLLPNPGWAADVNRGRIPTLSLEAMRYGLRLDAMEVPALTARLYFYNRFPVTRSMKLRLPTPEAVACYLGVHDGGPMRSLLGRWTAMPSGGDVGWSTWRSNFSTRSDGIPFKLYVSPTPDATSEALSCVLEGFSRCDSVAAFKVPRDVHGLCRPDKIVAYVVDEEALHRLGAALAERMHGIPAQGVPFTAAISEDGLLSWGQDPPRPRRGQAESWRLWVIQRLASYLSEARAGAYDVDPIAFALERIGLDGVDPVDWSPSPDIWD
jgi:hypothetical protein